MIEIPQNPFDFEMVLRYFERKQKQFLPGLIHEMCRFVFALR